MRTVIVATVFVMLALVATHGAAEERVMEIIQLKHRLIGDVLPTLRELVAEGGTVTGMNEQLVIRTTPENLADLKQVLGALDTRLNQLRITVRQDVEAATQRREDALSARVRSGDVEASAGHPGAGAGAGIRLGGDDYQATYRGLSTRGIEDAANTHFVTTVEGRPAYINTGQAVPQAEGTVVYSPYGPLVRDTMTYRDVGAGFYVTPRVVGNSEVSLEISPYADNLDSRGAGAIDTRGLSTLVSGRLGEWIALGGAAQSFDDAGSAYGYRTRRSGHELYDVWVKVDIVP